MYAKVCDNCGRVLNVTSTEINRKENPAILVCSADFPTQEFQFHLCYKCIQHFFAGTKIGIEIDRCIVKEGKNNVEIRS